MTYSFWIKFSNSGYSDIAPPLPSNYLFLPPSGKFMNQVPFYSYKHRNTHGLRTPGEEIVFTARPKINSHSQIFRYGRSIFCRPHPPNFSDIFDLCLHWVSVVRDIAHHGAIQECCHLKSWVY